MSLKGSAVFDTILVPTNSFFLKHGNKAVEMGWCLTLDL